MKKICTLMLCVLLLLPVVSVFAGATDVEVTNADRPSVELAVTQEAEEGDILIVTVSLMGCEGLTDADLRFTYDPEVLTYLGASLTGACAADPDVIVSFPDADEAKGWVAVSFFHMDRFDVYEGNGAFCELAFRTAQGRSAVKAEAISFRIDEEAASPKLGSCKYSSGFSSFFRENGSMLLIVAVIAIVVIVLIVLLAMIRKTKKKMPTPEPFEDAAPDAETEAEASEDAETADGTAAEETAANEEAAEENEEQPEESDEQAAQATTAEEDATDAAPIAEDGGVQQLEEKTDNAQEKKENQ